jgi:hypothetical protein
LDIQRHLSISRLRVEIDVWLAQKAKGRENCKMRHSPAAKLLPCLANFMENCLTGKSLLNRVCDVSSPSRKNILLFRNRKSAYINPVLLRKEGRWPSSRTLERDAMDATASGAQGVAGRVLP